MKTYINHKFNIIEDDNNIVSNNVSKTDNVCNVLVVIAVILIAVAIITIGGLK